MLIWLAFMSPDIYDQLRSVSTSTQMTAWLSTYYLITPEFINQVKRSLVIDQATFFPEWKGQCVCLQVEIMYLIGHAKVLVGLSLNLSNPHAILLWHLKMIETF